MGFLLKIMFLLLPALFAIQSEFLLLPEKNNVAVLQNKQNKSTFFRSTSEDKVIDNQESLPVAVSLINKKDFCPILHYP